MQQSDYVRSFAFLFLVFFSRTWPRLLPVVGHYCRTRRRTPSSKCLPQGQFPLCRVWFWPLVIRMDPSPPSVFCMYLSVIFFSDPCLFDTCLCDMIYLHHTAMNNLVAPRCVYSVLMYKHVLRRCTTMIRCRAVVELCSTIWEAYTKPYAV